MRYKPTLHHRAPPSFPTRRSSDLTRQHLDSVLANPHDRTLRYVFADSLSEHGDPRGEFINLQLAPPDRKSTRLNSSHLVISYAVFCLKKKKRNENEKVKTIINDNI